MGESQAVGQLVEILVGTGLKAPGAQLLLAPAEDAAQPKGYSKEVLFEPLTKRELDVLRLAAAARTNREIADELVITLGTAK